MINYTNSVLALRVKNRDLTQMDNYVSLKQGTEVETFTGDRLIVETETEEGVTNTIIRVLLTQEESAAFDFDKDVEVQVNWISAQGIRDATNIKYIPVMRNLLDKVIEYGQS